MASGARTLAEVRVDADSWRMIPSRYPPIRLYETLLDPADLDAAYQLEALTNDRLREEAGDIGMVPAEDRLVGPGTSVIMAAFTHIGTPSRFTDGSFGVYYAGLDAETALRESLHSQSRRLSATREAPQIVQMRTYVVRVDCNCHDATRNTRIHKPDDWSAAQTLARSLKKAGTPAILYRSVRNPDGRCIAALRPAALKPPAVQGAHYELHWDGERFTHYSEIRGIF
jgi:RES domain